jgi:hypothetical protein
VSCHITSNFPLTRCIYNFIAEIRQLDSDRQSLVYNHHHELIAASDTIGAVSQVAQRFFIFPRHRLVHVFFSSLLIHLFDHSLILHFTISSSCLSTPFSSLGHSSWMLVGVFSWLSYLVPSISIGALTHSFTHSLLFLQCIDETPSREPRW